MASVQQKYSKTNKHNKHHLFTTTYKPLFISSQAEGRGFESRIPLTLNINNLQTNNTL